MVQSLFVFAAMPGEFGGQLSICVQNDSNLYANRVTVRIDPHQTFHKNLNDIQTPMEVEKFFAEVQSPAGENACNKEMPPYSRPKEELLVEIESTKNLLTGSE
jgi:hypothetical protein